MTTPISPTSASLPRFVYQTATSTLHDALALEALVGPYLAALAELGGVAWDPAGEATGPRVVFVATGGTERQILEHSPFSADEPAVIVAHPGHNSLPASLETLSRAQQLGFRGRIVYLRGSDDVEGLQQLDAAIHDLSVRRALRASRIGLVGAPSDWLVASSPAPETVRAVWGPVVVPVSLDTILGEPDAQVVAIGEAVARELRQRATALAEPAESDLAPAGNVHEMLRRVVESERLDAITVRCFDLVVRKHTTGCVALANLNDEGVVAGCEGDLVTTVAMLWLRLMLGATSWMANPSRIDPERGTLLLAHCTVPRSMGSEYALRSHFESGLGVAVQGVLPSGPVTLVRLGGVRMERLRALDGLLVRNTDHADLCRTQVEVEIGGEALRALLTDPLGNHMVMVPGHHAAALKLWHETMIG